MNTLRSEIVPFRRFVLMLIILAFVYLSSPSYAIGGTKRFSSFSSDVLYYGSDEHITTICFITNVGTKAIILSSPGILNFGAGNGGIIYSPDSDSCSTAPLDPNKTCFFRGDAGVYGGGVVEVQGNPRDFRGRCGAYSNVSGKEVTFSQMR